MTKTKFAFAASLMCGAITSVQAADKPPAVYWMSVSTEVGGAFGMGGMAMPSVGEMVTEGLLGGIFGGSSKSSPSDAGGARRSVLLQLSGAETPPDPKADHFIPPGQNMGESLPLISPRAGKLSRHEAPDEAQEPEKPKGKILMYWGCGDKIRASQPKVLDMATATPQQYAAFFKAFNVSAPRGPRPANGWTYARWPNEKDSQSVPKDSSLVGPQTIKANYAPEIRFDIPRQQDFLDPVVFTEMGSDLTKAVPFHWKPIPNATGYFSMAMGGQGDNEMVIWVSSEASHMGWSLMDYVPTGEVRKLIKERVIMPPSNTECKIPQGVFKDAGAMLQFIAYGQDLDLSHPARPKNPPKGWMPDWNTKVRLKSTTMTMLGQDPREKAAAGAGASGGRDYTSQPRKKGGSEVLENPLKSIKGIFGL
ncbi:MAG: hypothetical protein Q7V00_01585 [Sulfurimicrobium sp.]|nr:hypothetical protein [Sulfurimicrobium sp.]MDP1703169.1 hypothetical protein [Sulfurimicrobium sp.]MDP2197686.1 hypothetical protein [Sulfurimicrobium sp.]MDP3686789.1 hypothetical protein [Sulfurimicrobium sp.]